MEILDKIDKLLDGGDENERLQKVFDERVAKEPMDMGNGVLYFRSYSTRFLKDLTVYRKNHPNKEIISISPFMSDHGYGGSASVNGYIVVLKQ